METKEAAGLLSKQVSGHQMEKKYIWLLFVENSDNFWTYVDYLCGKTGKIIFLKIVDKG